MHDFFLLFQKQIQKMKIEIRSVAIITNFIFTGFKSRFRKWRLKFKSVLAAKNPVLAVSKADSENEDWNSDSKFLQIVPIHLVSKADSENEDWNPVRVKTVHFQPFLFQKQIQKMKIEIQNYLNCLIFLPLSCFKSRFRKWRLKL